LLLTFRLSHKNRPFSQHEYWYTPPNFTGYETLFYAKNTVYQYSKTAMESDDNGIFAQVPGQYIAQALQALPPPETAEGRPYGVEAEAGELGRVRILARPARVKHNKHAHWYWAPYYAELA
jgi:hypothetical protein